MPDVYDRKTRSKVMSRIRKTNTKPELVVRRLSHALGFRFRLHRSDLPGTPDLVFPRHRKVILVHGCWWHRHNCRLGRREPKSRRKYWIPKLKGNVARDRKVKRQLRRLGWSVLTVWECQTKDLQRLEDGLCRSSTGSASWQAERRCVTWKTEMTRGAANARIVCFWTSFGGPFSRGKDEG